MSKIKKSKKSKKKIQQEVESMSIVLGD